jgi:hypothetical protein
MSLCDQEKFITQFDFRKDLMDKSHIQFGKQYDNELETDLTTVFEAIGKNNGQNLYVEIGNNL